MKQSRLLKRSTALLLALVLLVATALLAVGCAKKAPPSLEPVQNAISKGQGETQFTFTVIDPAGEQTAFLVNTDKTLVGEALQEVGLVEGEEGPYGLYVKVVNGIPLDYEKDGKYWAFYVDGKYGEKGVEQTEIDPSRIYTFRAE